MIVSPAYFIGVLEGDFSLKFFIDDIVGNAILRLDVQLQTSDKGALFSGMKINFCCFRQFINIKLVTLVLHEKLRLQIISLCFFCSPCFCRGGPFLRHHWFSTSALFCSFFISRFFAHAETPLSQFKVPFIIHAKNVKCKTLYPFMLPKENT